MAYYTSFETADEAKAAFEAFIATIPEATRSLIEDNSIANAWSVETFDEYDDDLHRWTVSLATAKEYVDQGVTSF